MKLKQYALLLILTTLIIALVTGCSQSDKGMDKVPTLTETLTSINVKPGETFHIVLDSNVTTGYGWVWKNKDDIHGVTFLSSDYETSPGSEDRTGAGGQENWQLKANEEGTFTLDFIYVFQGQTDENPAEQISFTVHVTS